MTRDEIISEIRRTAAANDGKPLGKSRFFAETGIRESDWSGRFWVRWSDALREAGYAPNQLNPSLPDEDLLRSLASLVAELGRFPLSAELRLKAKSDPTFPSHNTFRRFGGKADLARKLRDYARERGLSSVSQLAEAVAGPEATPEEASDNSEVVEYGFVYLFRSGRHFKLGRTNAVGRRERELAIQLPEKLTLVHSIRTDDPAGIEHYWHRRFADRRLNGEWFRLTASDVAAFRRRKFM
jgi:hypothetical protein